MIRQSRLVLVALLVCLTGGPTTVAIAQVRTQMEKDIAEARRLADQKREDAARDQKNADARAAEVAALRNAERGAAAREASDRADAARWQERFDAENTRRAAFKESRDVQQRELNKRYLVAAREELSAHPFPAASSEPISECDRAGAVASDPTRPIGLPGIAYAVDVSAVQAVAACTAETEKTPASARALFQLGNGLLAAAKCSQARAAWDRAEALGSSAAAYEKGLFDRNCKPALDDAQLRKAVEMGNADAALTIADSRRREFARLSGLRLSGKKAEKNQDDMWSAHFDQWFYQMKSAELNKERARLGDRHALQNLAAIASDEDLATRLLHDDGGSNRAQYTSVFPNWASRAHWIYLCIAADVKPCESFDIVRDSVSY